MTAKQNHYYLIPDEKVKPMVLEIKPGGKYLIVLKTSGRERLSQYQEDLLKATFERGLQQIMQEAEYALVVVQGEVKMEVYELSSGQ